MFDRNRAFWCRDKVSVFRSPAKNIHLQSPSRERDDVPTPTTVIDTPTVVADSASVDGIDTPSTSTARATDDDGSASLQDPLTSTSKINRWWLTGWGRGGLENCVDLRLYLQLTRTHPQSRPNQAKSDERQRTCLGRLESQFLIQPFQPRQRQQLLSPAPKIWLDRPLPYYASSNNVASSAREVSLVSSPSIHEQAGSSDELPPKNIQGSSLRAVVHVTRVMTSDYGSVGKYVSPQVAELAHMLMKQARGEEVVFREKDNEKLKDAITRNKITSFESPSYQCRPSHQLNTFRNPAISNSSTSNPHSSAAKPAVPGWSAARPYTTLLLLLRARDCKSTAPACPTGMKVADRQEDNNWPGDASDDRLEENDEKGDEEGSLTGGGGDTRSLKEGDEEGSFTGGSGEYYRLEYFASDAVV
ncbi:hypothetical protein M378DRAFT_17205 [Amanita muscaria Koide BX008]|uniref:Uncharacterized protein n=1 Tax=Amanita muscaria (strain Koide BX008) TaxID=946122 RepID=A0A0C2SQK4_AMAMK|nr:hypothetical protein M378DRAFT_17205 [Amanita muscaria Koide BX008]